MINHYTASRKVRNDDAYSPGGRIKLRPDRATLAYCQRAREAFPGVPVIAGGVEASMRRLAHYDYWSDKVRRSILLDAKADLLSLRYGRRRHRRSSPGNSTPADRSKRSVASGGSLTPWVPVKLTAQTQRPSSCRRTTTSPTAATPSPEATRLIHLESNPAQRPHAGPIPRPAGRGADAAAPAALTRGIWIVSTTCRSPPPPTPELHERRSPRTR